MRNSIRSTIRNNLTATLAQEILSRPTPESFLIESEHQLCKRFNVSRVTVRLALGDLENRGLIYRRQGKGTFAHGKASRPTKMVALLLKTPPQPEYWPITEIIRGIQSELSQERTAMLMVSSSPKEWSAEMASQLSGVIVFPTDVSQHELDVLRDRKLPFVLLGESLELSGPRIRLGQMEAARKTVENLVHLGHKRIALLTGFESTLDAAKREGIHQALRAAQISPELVPEISCRHHGGAEAAIKSLLALDPRPTAVIAFDDGLAALLCMRARSDYGLVVPADLSVASFHNSPYLGYLEPGLSTVQFDFVGMGRVAAEQISRVALTGEAATDVDFEPIYQAGQTLGTPKD